jgi:hypothetical protein
MAISITNVGISQQMFMNGASTMLRCSFAKAMGTNAIRISSLTDLASGNVTVFSPNDPINGELNCHLRRRLAASGTTGISVSVNIDIVGDTGPAMTMLTAMSQNATVLNQVLAPYENNLAAVSGLSLTTIQSGMVLVPPVKAAATGPTLPVAGIAVGAVLGTLLLFGAVAGLSRRAQNQRINKLKKDLTVPPIDEKKAEIIYYTNVLYNQQVIETKNKKIHVIESSPRQSPRNSTDSPRSISDLIL